MISHSLTRRRFCQCALATVGSLAVPPLLANVAGAFGKVPIQYWVNGFDERYGEISLIQRAMSIVHEEFRSMQVLDNAYRLSGNAYYIKGGYWEQCGMNRQRWFGYNGLLSYQIRVLAGAVPFPNVIIDAFNSQAAVMGDAEAGIVKVFYSSGYSWRGQFKLRLNRRLLATGGVYSDPANWAGVIAHEMLHNLGHLHADGDYSLGVQINAFAAAVAMNGAAEFNTPGPFVRD